MSDLEPHPSSRPRLRLVAGVVGAVVVAAGAAAIALSAGHDGGPAARAQAAVPVLDSAAMVYDPATATDVVVGVTGLRPGAGKIETWIWDGSGWTQEHPATVPSAGLGGPLELGYNPATHEVVLILPEPQSPLSNQHVTCPYESSPGGGGGGPVLGSGGAAVGGAGAGTSGSGSASGGSISGGNLHTIPAQPICTIPRVLPPQEATWLWNGTTWTSGPRLPMGDAHLVADMATGQLLAVGAQYGPSCWYAAPTKFTVICPEMPAQGAAGGVVSNSASEFVVPVTTAVSLLSGGKWVTEPSFKSLVSNVAVATDPVSGHAVVLEVGPASGGPPCLGAAGGVPNSAKATPLPCAMRRAAPMATLYTWNGKTFTGHSLNPGPQNPLPSQVLLVADAAHSRLLAVTPKYGPTGVTQLLTADLSALSWQPLGKPTVLHSGTAGMAAAEGPGGDPLLLVETPAVGFSGIGGGPVVGAPTTVTGVTPFEPLPTATAHPHPVPLPPVQVHPAEAQLLSFNGTEWVVVGATTATPSTSASASASAAATASATAISTAPATPTPGQIVPSAPPSTTPVPSAAASPSATASPTVTPSLPSCPPNAMCLPPAGTGSATP